MRGFTWNVCCVRVTDIKCRWRQLHLYLLVACWSFFFTMLFVKRHRVINFYAFRKKVWTVLKLETTGFFNVKFYTKIAVLNEFVQTHICAVKQGCICQISTRGSDFLVYVPGQKALRARIAPLPWGSRLLLLEIFGKLFLKKWILKHRLSRKNW